jgi:hypothetical protein
MFGESPSATLHQPLRKKADCAGHSECRLLTQSGEAKGGREKSATALCSPSLRRATSISSD